MDEAFRRLIWVFRQRPVYTALIWTFICETTFLDTPTQQVSCKYHVPCFDWTSELTSCCSASPTTTPSASPPPPCRPGVQGPLQLVLPGAPARRLQPQVLRQAVLQVLLPFEPISYKLRQRVTTKTRLRETAHNKSWAWSRSHAWAVVCFLR